MRVQDTYYPPKRLATGGAVIEIFTPILTATERTDRMNAIHNAAADLLREATETI